MMVLFFLSSILLYYNRDIVKIDHLLPRFTSLVQCSLQTLILYQLSHLLPIKDSVTSLCPLLDLIKISILWMIILFLMFMKWIFTIRLQLSDLLLLHWTHLYLIILSPFLYQHFIVLLHLFTRNHRLRLLIYSLKITGD